MGPPKHVGDSDRKRCAKTTEFSLSAVDTKKKPPYDPRDPKQELPPKSVTLTKEWATLANGVQKILELITEPLDAMPNKSQLMIDLINRINDELQDREGQRIVVGVSGNMGGGKSATLNSLFHVFGNIAREGDTGVSCTLSSNSFSGPKDGQTAPFLAEVQFFTPEERRGIIAIYLRDYYLAYHGVDGEDQDAEDAELNPAIKDEVAKVFVSLFKDRPQCCNKKEARKFLAGANSEDDPDLLQLMVEWSETVIRRRTGAGKTVIFQASTPGELLSQLEGYATEAVDEDGSAGASLWPLVSLIRFHFSDRLTDLGITFLDSPGLSDHNKARRMSALKFAKWKTHALVVTDASRAGDDPTVATEVRSMVRRGPDRVVVVIPKSDVIGDSLGQLGSRNERQKVQQLQDAQRGLEEQLEGLDNKIATCEENGDDDLILELTRQRNRLEVAVKQAENSEKAFRIKLRSEASKSRLHEKLADLAKSTRDIPVISVSNRMYAQHLMGYPAKKAPILNVEETKIPELRRLLFTFPNEARLNEANHRQNAAIPSLLSRLRLFTARTPVERKADMEKYVIFPHENYSKTMNAVFDSFVKTIKERILDKILAEDSSWSDSARKLCAQWEDEYKTAVFTTLMKRQGHRRGTKKSTAIDMSAELMKIKERKMATIFKSSVQSQQALQANLEEEVLGLVEDMIANFKADPSFNFVDLEDFVKYLHSKKATLKHDIQHSAASVLSGIQAVEKKATFADQEAYIVEAMGPIYDKVFAMKAPRGAAAKSGPKPKAGWPKFRKDTFKQEVCQSNGVWAAVYNGAQADLMACIEKERLALDEQVGKVFKDYRTGFDERCQAAEMSDPQVKAIQEQLAKNLDDAEAILNGKMRRNFDSLWRDFRACS